MHPAPCPTCCVRRASFFCPVPPPSSNARPPFAASVPAGRQCHHSAASSSARLNTGAKVQTAVGSGRRALADTCNNTLWKKKNKQTTSHEYSASLCAKSLTNSHAHKTNLLRQSGPNSHLRGAELLPRWWLVSHVNRNFINPEVNTLWTRVYLTILRTFQLRHPPSLNPISTSVHLTRSA